MNGRRIQEALSGVSVIIFIGAVGFLAAHCLTGCALFGGKSADEPKLPEYCYDEDLLRAKVFACVASAETKAESQACRKQSLQKCGIEVTP